MKIAILGYGKMGRQVEEILQRQGHDIVTVIDNEEEWDERMAQFRTADAAIDFSVPSSAVPNMYRAFESHVPIVVGTTGWLPRMDEVTARCRECDGSLVYGSNFSIGANLFMQLNRFLASFMNNQPQYSAEIEETHHVMKKDAPSGTAIRLAADIVKAVDRLDGWKPAGESAGEEFLPVVSHRVGTVPGTHLVSWKSEVDDIRIVHEAHSRKGFAEGAVKAACWLLRHPGIHDFQDIVFELDK